jgi:hypothetical protein
MLPLQAPAAIDTYPLSPLSPASGFSNCRSYGELESPVTPITPVPETAISGITIEVTSYAVAM